MSHKLVSLYIGDGEYYTRTDADAVIAELEKKLKEQTSIAEERWKGFSKYHTSYAEAVKELYEKNKELRYHKYKRCLNNAWWCLREEFYAEDCHCERWVDWAIKWHKRWLELAEKFKPSKE